MLCYAVIDTNVLVSALLTNKEDAATAQVIKRFIAGEITPIFSKAIMDEYRDVLLRKKFGFSEETVEYLLTAITKFGIFVEPSQSGIILPDIKDLPFYEVVLEKQEKGAYLVTGNTKHFPKQPFVVTARQMIDILDKYRDAE